jgi:hypothetical protein
MSTQIVVVEVQKTILSMETLTFGREGPILVTQIKTILLIDGKDLVVLEIL